MRRSVPSATPDPAPDARCAECGGELVAGSVGLPLLGSPRFAYRLGTMDVAVDVAARMCESCGLVVFRVANPGPIRDARRALQRAQGQGPQQLLPHGQGSTPPNTARNR